MTHSTFCPAELPLPITASLTRNLYHGAATRVANVPDAPPISIRRNLMLPARVWRTRIAHSPTRRAIHFSEQQRRIVTTNHADESRPLAGRTALVTGGSRGLGLACAQALATDGAHVIVAARNKDQITAAVRGIVSGGGKASGYQIDVSEADAMASLYSWLDDQSLPSDIVINAAGMFRYGSIDRTSTADWEQLSRTNVASTLLSCQQAVSRMRSAGWGRIVNFCSVAGALRGAPGAVAYAMSKGAIAALTRSLAVEVALDRITVNAIAPGMFETEMTDGFRTNEARAEWATSRAAAGRWGQPAEVAGLVRYLTSPTGGFLTGQILAVDGGWTA